MSLTVDPEKVLDPRPARLWASFPAPTHAATADIAGSFCSHVHFLAGAPARDRWPAEHEDGLALSLDDAFELGRLATLALTRAVRRRLMTVGELSRRCGLSVKAIREYEGLGLIYSAGRSEANYRLFDDSALWCARTITELRAVGLTIKEIKRLADLYLAQPDEPIGPQIAAALDEADRRAGERVDELLALRRRIRRYREGHADALAGRRNEDFGTSDPRRARRIA